jgi:hypothetical protein
MTARDGGRTAPWLLMAIAIALLDYATARAADALGVPFYLDTWATSVGVLVGGLVPGLLGGSLYCTAMAATVWGPAGLVWVLSSANVALLAWAFRRGGWIDIEAPFALLAAGTVTGTLNTILAALLEPIVYGGSNPFDKSILFRQLFERTLGSSALVAHLDDLLVEVTDKSVCIIIAAATATLLAERYSWARSGPAARPR